MSFKNDYIANSESNLAAVFQVESTLHVGVDFQKAFCQFPYDPALFSKEMKLYYERQQALLTEVAAMGQAFREAGVRNVWVQQEGSFEEREFADDSFYKRGVSRQKVLDFAATAHELCVPVADRDSVMLKNDFNLFTTVGAAQKLRMHGAKTLLLTGGAKDVCLLETAKGAVENGFTTFMIDDLTYLANAYEPEREISEAVLRVCVEKGIGVVQSAHVRSLLLKP